MASSMTLGAAIRQIHGLFDSGRLDEVADGQLLDRFLTSRDALAFEALVARHGPMVRATCRALVRDPHDADDAFQATFLALVRKGGTVRGAGALGGWLHRVAHRAAIQANVAAARRRDEERRAGLARAVAAPPSPAGRDESIAAVHDELDRLPDRFRLPVVLCHLEGKTHAQAAFELGWGEATVRRRLAVARDRLRHRLTRRGVAPAPAHLALARPPVALPSAWIEAISRLAAGRISAIAASALAGHALRALALSQARGVARVAATLVATLGLGLAAGLGRSSVEPTGPAEPASPPPVPAQAPAPAPAPAAEHPPQPGSAPEVVSGRVSLNGRPVADATIRHREFGDDQVEPAVDAPPLARSDSSGEFWARMPARGSKLDRRLVATLPGLGLGWADVDRGLSLAMAEDRPAVIAPWPSHSVPQSARLEMAEDRPIEGRIVDLEGRPVAGAEVGVFWVANLRRGVDSFLASVAHDGELADWLPSDNPTWYGRLPGQPSFVKAGPDGRFRLEGLGSDRLAQLIVRGPRIAEAKVMVLNREMDPILGPKSTRPQPEPPAPLRVFGSTFRFAVEPSRPIEGVVRDRATGRPLAGVRVTSPRISDKSLDRSGGVGSTTDAQGRFALDGLPKGPSYTLFAIPGPGSTHLAGGVEVADAVGLGPIRAELLLSAGIPFRIRPVDAATGKPVDARVVYHPLCPNVEALAGRVTGLGPLSTAARQPDGSYTGVAPPGPGAICVEVPGGDYLQTRADPWAFFRPGAGSRPRDALVYGDENMLIVQDGPGTWLISSEPFAEVALIDPRPGSGPIERDAKLAPALKMWVPIVSPGGAPVRWPEVWAADGSPRWSAPLTESGFWATRLDPRHPRRIVARGPFNLIGQVTVPPLEGARVDLKWPAIVKGRLVDARGKPRPGLMLRPKGGDEPRPDDGLFIGWIQTDAEGRFLARGLVPGLRYRLAVMVDGSLDEGSTLFDDLVLQPNENRDLGDIRAEADRPKPMPGPKP